MQTVMHKSFNDRRRRSRYVIRGRLRSAFYDGSDGPVRFDDTAQESSENLIVVLTALVMGFISTISSMTIGSINIVFQELWI